MTLKEAIKYGKQENHDIIMMKNANFKSGKWGEMVHAEACSWKLVDTIPTLYRIFEKIRKDV